MTAIFQLFWLLFVASAVSALEEPFSNGRQGLLHDEYKLKDLANTGADEVPAESLISIIIEQGKTIKDMEMTMNMITKTVKIVYQQRGQILLMQGKINDMEKIIQRQDQEINNLKHENVVLNDKITNQRAEMHSMGKEIMKINETVHVMSEENAVKGKKIGNNQHGIARANLTDVLPTSIRKKTKTKTTATTKNGDRVIEDNNGELISEKKSNIRFNNQGKHQTGIFGNEHHRLQRRAVTHVGFSAYMSHKLDHMNIGNVIKFDQIILNDGNGYNKYTGVFTVPVSGVYLLTHSIDSTNRSYLQVELTVDNRNLGILRAVNGAMTSKTTVIRLTAGQSVWLEIAMTDAGFYSTVAQTLLNTTFSGVFLY